MSYIDHLRTLGNLDHRSPSYLHRLVESHCKEASRRTSEDRTRYYLIGVEHYWHGYIERLMETQASPEKLQEVFEEGNQWSQLDIHKCEEFAKAEQ